MRQVAKRGILTAVATGSVLASTAGYAFASTEAQGGAVNSAGVGSGNSVQAPVDIPVNACGNTVNVVGLLNPAMGNNCGNAAPAGSGRSAHGSSAAGTAHDSPGVGSGNHVQAPISVPVNACGNSVDVIGLGNPAFGNSCGNQAVHHPTPPPPPSGDDCSPGEHNPPPPTVTPPVTTPPTSTLPTGTPPGRIGGTTDVPPTSTTQVGLPGTVPAQSVTSPATHGRLASTGADGLGLLASSGAALLLGGGVLYRRSKVAR